MINKKNFSNELKFHHYGVAVKSFKETKKFYKSLNYKFGKKIIDKKQNVELILCKSKNFPSVELIKPLNNKSPISRLLNESETSIYHICYEAKKKNFNISKFLKGYNYVCISEPKPDKLFKKRYTGFYYLKNFGLIEILYN
jgi:methylmalonyl-CoA/ethylmalonyl-CoA epimerase